MKYFSEITKKYYDSEKEALSAEEVAIKEKEEAEAKRAAEEKALTTRKKELADKVDIAESALDEAYNHYREVQRECSLKLQEAGEVVKKAEAEKVNAIKEFNKQFGVYRTCYTGEKAQKEFDRLFDSFWNSFLMF